MSKPIDIIFADDRVLYEGEEITVVSKESLIYLDAIIKEGEDINKKADKIIHNREKAKRHANKFMKRIVDSHNIQYNDEKQAVAVSDSDVLYIGDKSRLQLDPSSEPVDGDIVKGKITKSERRKYNEVLNNFEFINNKIKQHNSLVSDNQSKLLQFEQDVLIDKEYDKEKSYLVVFKETGKVMLCIKQ